jgi:large subunit ribosomal protein L10
LVGVLRVKQNFFMLTKEQKRQLVKNLSDKIKSAKSVVFVDFKGLKVKDLAILKKDLRKENITFQVLKKTLIQKALEENGAKMKAKDLEGQIAVSVSRDDEIAPAKILANFGKKSENLKILAGLLGAKELSADEVKNLAKLPGKVELLAKLVGTINAPISGFVNVLAGNMRGLVQVLKAISETKN